MLVNSVTPLIWEICLPTVEVSWSQAPQPVDSSEPPGFPPGDREHADSRTSRQAVAAHPETPPLSLVEEPRTWVIVAPGSPNP